MRTTVLYCVLLSSLLTTACAGRRHHVQPEIVSKASPKTLPVLTATCEALQSKGLPVQCSTGFSQGILVMTTQFAAQNALDTYHDAIEQQVGLPFCAAAARSGQTAAVLERLPGRGSRVLVCATKKWTEWEQPTPAITAGQTCESVNSSRELPVYCQVVHANGMYTMTIKFMPQAELEQHIKPMLLHVGEPFCAATVKSGDGGLVRLQRAHDNAHATYNCETRTIGQWQPPRPEPAPQTSSPAPSSASRPNTNGATTL